MPIRVYFYYLLMNSLSVDYILIIRMAWDLEEASLETVESLDRLAIPTFNTIFNSTIEVIKISVAPMICTPSFESYRIYKFLSYEIRRSLITSL